MSQWIATASNLRSQQQMVLPPIVLQQGNLWDIISITDNDLGQVCEDRYSKSILQNVT